jgi:hypothetical protein
LAQWRRATAVFIAGLLLVGGPIQALRPAGHHEVWQMLWMGLGDFDRVKGHVWTDHVACMLLKNAGFARDAPSSLPIYELDVNTHEKEAFFRDQFLADIRVDPAWFAHVLARRLIATITQSKLLEFGSQRDPAMVPRPAFNEGAILFFYSRVTTADWIGFSSLRFVVPLPLYWAMGLLLFVILFFERRHPKTRSTLWLLACVGLSAITMPVLITTAGAMETQAFILVYFVILALLVERLACIARTILKIQKDRQPAASI